MPIGWQHWHYWRGVEAPPPSTVVDTSPSAAGRPIWWRREEWENQWVIAVPQWYREELTREDAEVAARVGRGVNLLDETAADRQARAERLRAQSDALRADPYPDRIGFRPPPSFIEEEMDEMIKVMDQFRAEEEAEASDKRARMERMEQLRMAARARRFEEQEQKRKGRLNRDIERMAGKISTLPALEQAEKEMELARKLKMAKVRAHQKKGRKK